MRKKHIAPSGLSSTNDLWFSEVKGTAIVISTEGTIEETKKAGKFERAYEIGEITGNEGTATLRDNVKPLTGR